MKIIEKFWQFISAIILIYILFFIMKTLDFGLAFSTLIFFLLIGISILWLLKELKIIK